MTRGAAARSMVTGAFTLLLAATTALAQPPAKVIFADGFESGDLSRWSASSTDNGDLSVSPAASMASTTQGLQGVVNDTAALYVEDDSPNDDSHYRASFYFDPNGFDPGEAQSHFRTRIFIAFQEAPTRRLAAVVLKRQGSVFSVMGRARLDDDTQADTGFFTLTDAAHRIGIDLHRASGPGTGDGAFQLRIDDAVVSTLPNLGNSLSGVDFTRLGALSVKSGAAGTVYGDEFEARRDEAPTATINHPLDGEMRTAGVPIPFVGSSSDPEDGTLSGAALSWTSDPGGPLGTGTSFSSALSAGTYVITLTATDSDGNQTASRITLFVTP